jgi:acyl carrier protein
LASNIEEIEQQLVEMLVSFLGGARDLSRDTDLLVDLRLESVQVMEFVVEVEDHYDIAIDLETLSEARTVGDLAAIVARAGGA